MYTVHKNICSCRVRLPSGPPLKTAGRQCFWRFLIFCSTHFSTRFIFRFSISRVENGLKYTIDNLRGAMAFALGFVAVYAESVHAAAVPDNCLHEFKRQVCFVERNEGVPQFVQAGFNPVLFAPRCPLVVNIIWIRHFSVLARENPRRYQALAIEHCALVIKNTHGCRS